MVAILTFPSFTNALAGGGGAQVEKSLRAPTVSVTPLSMDAFVVYKSVNQKYFHLFMITTKRCNIRISGAKGDVLLPRRKSFLICLAKDLAIQ